MILSREPHKHLFYELKALAPPTVFVDNNSGYTIYNPVTSGYKNTSLTYSSIRFVAGLNIYCSSESIGICIFKNETMFSLVDIEFSDFFGVSISSDTSVAILAAMVVSEERIIVTAVANVDPSIDKVLTKSRDIEIDGVRISTTTTFFPEKITSKEKDNHSLLYNEDGEYTGETIDDKFITYEGYNGSTGFGDVGTDTHVFPDNSKALIYLMNVFISDVSSLNSDISFLKDKSIYAVDSFIHDGMLFFVGVSTKSVYVVSIKKDGTVTNHSMTFAKATTRESFNNVLLSSLQVIPNYKKGLMSEYIPIYTPPGVMLNPKRYYGIVITRAEKDEESKDVVAEYILTVQKKEEEYHLSGKKDDDGKLVSTISYPTDVPPDSSRYVSGITIGSINPSAYMETDIAARNGAIKHYKYTENSIPNQDGRVYVVTSMCETVSYM